MVQVKFWEVVAGQRKEYVLRLSRVPCIGETIMIDTHPMVVKACTHLPLFQSDSVAAVCFITD